jgi:hypothetical protein
MARRGERRGGEGTKGAWGGAARRDGRLRREPARDEPRGATRDPEPRRGATDALLGEESDYPILRDDGDER